jgi:hypothetical protein
LFGPHTWHRRDWGGWRAERKRRISDIDKLVTFGILLLISPSKNYSSAMLFYGIHVVMYEWIL